MIVADIAGSLAMTTFGRTSARALTGDVSAPQQARETASGVVGRSASRAQPLVAAVIFLTVLISAVAGQVHATRAGASTLGSVPPVDPAAVFQQVDWTKASYPMDCGNVGVKVLAVRTGSFTGDGRPEAVVHARCDAGAGSPPSGLFVFAGAPATRIATLLDPAADELVSQLTVDADGISAKGYRYSSPDVPKCCPDETFGYHWRWNGNAFVRS